MPTTAAISWPICLTSYLSRTASSLNLRPSGRLAVPPQPFTIGKFQERILDGSLKNLVNKLLYEAKGVWSNEMQDKLQCLVSIGTHVDELQAHGNDNNPLSPRSRGLT